MEFPCPECGTPVREVGRAAACPECGAAVRVPRRPQAPPPPPTLSPSETAAAVRGFGLLKFSLVLYVAGAVAGLGFLAARVAVDGVAGVAAGGPGRWPGLTAAAAAVGAVVAVAGVAVRVTGYGRCGPAGRAAGSDLFKPAAVGAVLQTAGVLAAAPFGLFPPAPGGPGPPADQAVLVLRLAGLLILAGTGLELCAVFGCRAVLERFGGPAAARPVRAYLWNLVPVGIGAGAGSLAVALELAAAWLNQMTPGPRDGAGAGAVVGGMTAAGAVAGVWLCRLYGRVLTACQRAVAGASSAGGLTRQREMPD